MRAMLCYPLTDEIGIIADRTARIHTLSEVREASCAGSLGAPKDEHDDAAEGVCSL
jgi:hypothetical protein